MESLYSFADLRKDAQALLALINTLPQKEWEKRLHGIFVRDQVQGPLALAWLWPSSRFRQPSNCNAVGPRPDNIVPQFELAVYVLF